MRANRLTRAKVKEDSVGLYAYDAQGAPQRDIPAHTLQGAETTEFSLTLKRSEKKLDEIERKPLPTGRKYMDLIEANGQQKLI